MPMIGTALLSDQAIVALNPPPHKHLHDKTVFTIRIIITPLGGMRISKPRTTRDGAYRRACSSQRSAKRPVSHESTKPDGDIDAIRDYLLSTRDFDAVSAPRLVSVHDNLPEYIQACVADRQFDRARAADRFRQDLQHELQHEADLLSTRRSYARPDVTVPRVSQATPQYFSTF
jgi:hypothetical protein